MKAGEDVNITAMFAKIDDIRKSRQTRTPYGRNRLRITHRVRGYALYPIIESLHKALT